MSDQAQNELIYQFFDILEPMVKDAIQRIIDANVTQINKPKKQSSTGSAKGEKKGDHGYPTADEVILMWNPGTNEVQIYDFNPLKKVYPPRYTEEKYIMSCLGCNSEVQEGAFDERKLIVFIEAMHLIVRDKCDPMAVHKALMGVREYRDGCAIDMPGMM
jgi:hypothetical protein